MNIAPYAWVEINTHALSHNLITLKNINPTHAMMIIIKGNAYGHGLLQIAQILEKQPYATLLATATLSDALYLRAQGIKKSILVLSCIDESVKDAIKNNIHLTLFDKQQIDVYCKAAEQLQTPCKIHLKVDTGLNRLGLNSNQAYKFIQSYSANPYIDIDGIFTHFADSGAERPVKTGLQRVVFKQLTQKLAKQNLLPPYVHSDNTAATIADQPKSHTNMVRIGAGFYGLWPSDHIKNYAQSHNVELKSAFTLKTRITNIKTIPAGESLGYGGAYTTTRNSLIALLPVGYYDGYNQRLANTGHVYINDQAAPVIGYVCMNMIMIDVTDIPDVTSGDTATLIGLQELITPTYLSEQIQSYNPRGILTAINPSFERRMI